MTKNVSRRILFLIALYVCIIFGIFAVQFTKDALFSRTIGDLVVTASLEPAESGVQKPVVPVHAAVYGVHFFIDEDTPAIAYTGNNTAIELEVTAISSDNNTFSLSFSDGSRVAFSTERRGDIRALEIGVSLSEDAAKISIPFKTARSARIEEENSQVLIRSDSQRFSFTGNAFRYDRSSPVQRLLIEESLPTVYYQTWLPAKGLNLESLVRNPAASDESYQAARDRFAAAALPVFRTTVSSGALNERIVTAYIAEMGRIGMYQTAVDAVPEGFRRSSARSYLSCPFLNSLEVSWQSMITLDREERSTLSRQFTENNPKVFEFPRLVPFLIDRGSGIFLDDIIRVASTIDLSTLTPLQAAGLIEIMQDMALYSPRHAEPLLLMAETCERILKESLIEARDKLYVVSPGTVIDVRSSLRIGQILRRYGTRPAVAGHWFHAGNLLITTLLSHQDSDMALPATLVPAAGGDSAALPVPADNRRIPPEEAYPLIMNDLSWYPRSVSLSREAGPGIWAWTAARSITVQTAADGAVRYSVRFPRGQTHYLVLSGIEPFTRIQLYGMDFRTDPRFESYNSSGYRYNAATKTLYLKMLHRDEAEDIVIYHGIPEAEEPDGASDSLPESDADREAGSESSPPSGDGTDSPAS